MNPISVDLRQKIIDVYADEDISQRQLAERFRVSLSSIQRILKQFRQGEGIEPKARGGGYPPTFSPAQLEKVRALIEANKDATLAQLCELVAQQEGEQVSRTTMWRIVQNMGMARKKKRAMPVNDIQTEPKS